MPSFRKLNGADVAAIEQGARSERAQIRHEYDAYLADFAPGDYGHVELVAHDRRALVRTRLQAAAQRRGFTLRFRPGPSSVLIFHVEAAPVPAVLPEPRSVPVSPDGADQPPAPLSRPAMRPSRPSRQPQTPTERYQTMLPRWMREQQRSGPRSGSKRRTR